MGGFQGDLNIAEEMVQRRRGCVRNLGLVVPAPQLHRILRIGLPDKAPGVFGIERPALQFEAPD